MITNDKTKLLAKASGLASLLLLVGPVGCGDDDSSNTDAGADVGEFDAGDQDTSGDTTGDATASSCAVVPGAWSATDFDTNAAEALAVREAIAVLQSDLMNTAEQVTWGDTPTDAPTLQELIDAYEAGSPSVKDVTSPELDALVLQTLADWVDALAEDPATYLFVDVDGTEWVATGAGGMHERSASDDGTRRFRAYSASGVELRQIVDKGLFVGALYNYALSLTEGDITPETVHALAAAWGSNPELVVNPEEGEAANDDSAAYARTMGLYDETADALIAAQAYAADADCVVERDEAIVEFFRMWEESMFARGTFYSGAPRLATLDATDVDTLLTPLHAASEGWGLIAGMLGMPEPTSGPLAGAARISTDADIESALTAIGVNLTDISEGEAATWLVASPATYNDAFLGEFKDVMQDLWGWDEATFELYATSPVASE